ncbi:MAG: 50S ribosomal protein L24 [Gemmatimonadaceae bacterium]
MRLLKYRKNAGKRLGSARHARNAERTAQRITKGDTVRVMRGDDKGREGKVLRVYPKTGRLTIDGINIVKKHRKARRAEEQSQILSVPAPLHHSNVMLVDPKSQLPTRVKMRVDADGTKERLAVKSGDAIPRTR